MMSLLMMVVVVGSSLLVVVGGGDSGNEKYLDEFIVEDLNLLRFCLVLTKPVFPVSLHFSYVFHEIRTLTLQLLYCNCDVPWDTGNSFSTC